MELTDKDVRTIIGIIDDAQHLEEIELVFAGLRLHVRRGGAGDAAGRPFAPASAAAVPAPLVREPAAGPPSGRSLSPLPQPSPRLEDALVGGEVAIRAPMIGTFYRAASPGDKPFVEVGQKVNADDNVAVIEVMKLFNTIRAGVDGVVVRIEAENASLVEFNQILIVVAVAQA